MYPYPLASDFSACLPTLMKVIQGQVVIADDIHALWVCAGFAASQVNTGAVMPHDLQAHAVDWKSLLKLILTLAAQAL